MLHVRPLFNYFLLIVSITSWQELPVLPEPQARGPERAQPQVRGPEPVPPSQQAFVLLPSCNQLLQTITSRRKAWKE